MRFAAIHKWSTYLVALTAFAAIALSGELDVVTLLIGFVGIAGSWWFEPPRARPERWQTLFTVLAVAALALAVLTIIAGEFLLAGARFLTQLLLIKLFSRRTSRDYQQIYLLSFLLLTTGSALNTGMSFAFCFLAFVVFATWALILFHLRREMEENFLLKHADDASSEKVEVQRILNSRRIVGPSFLLGTSGVSLAIFVSAVLMFLLVPRVGFGLFFQKGRGGVNVAGFSDRVQLGGHGTIRDDDTVVMRIYLDHPDYRSTEATAGLHWRGIAFDNYSKGRWSRGNLPARTAPSQSDATSRTVYLGRDDRPPRSTQAARAELAGQLRQDIYLEPLDTMVLFGASTPLAFKVPTIGVGYRARWVQTGAGNQVTMDRSQAIRYEVWSDPAPPDPARLAAAPDADPSRFAPYLQIPAEVPDRVRQLALRLTRDARGPHAKAQAVYDHLQKNYAYTLDMRTDEGYEPLDYFLFERKRGHCEYFSSAMAILLRAAGVPTRNVNGFLGGEWNEYGNYLAVRGGDAHSWLEVWYEGVGWVTWDPTPSASEVRRGTGWFDKARRLLDTLRLQWYKWVLEYDLSRQARLFKGIGEWFGASTGKASLKRAATWARAQRTPLAIGVGVTAALAAAFIWWRSRRRGGTSAARPRTSDDPLVQLYARTARWLARRGLPRGEGQTPREHARALVTRGAPGAAAFAALTELYYAARWAAQVDAPPAPAETLAEARRLADGVRAAFAEARRQARHAPPPPAPAAS